MKHTVSETAIEGRHLIKEFPMGNAVTKAVSYTHLDVYKRQVLSFT